MLTFIFHFSCPRGEIPPSPVYNRRSRGHTEPSSRLRGERGNTQSHAEREPGDPASPFVRAHRTAVEIGPACQATGRVKSRRNKRSGGSDCRQTYAKDCRYAWGKCNGGTGIPPLRAILPQWELLRKFPLWRSSCRHFVDSLSRRNKRSGGFVFSGGFVTGGRPPRPAGSWRCR